ncbi:MAG TPA: hypothetical protein VD929_02920 [Caulobacteraceae bacterium]|nr:hypothetical protein [Caulobacteraceae bacterium]
MPCFARAAAALTALLVCVFAVSPAEASAPPPEPSVEVTLRPAGDGEWIADYRFRRPAPAWVFRRSATTEEENLPWRPRSWTVETRGVRLERRGAHDVLTAGGRPLTRVRVRIKPFGEPLRADYVPVLHFTDGGRAHFVGQYAVAPLVSAAQAETLPSDLNVAALEDAPGRFTIRSREPMLLDGRVFQGRVETDFSRDRYVYVGRTPLTETEVIAVVADPGLPPWLRAEIDRLGPLLLAEHARRLGPRTGGRPTVYAGWGGAETPGVSFNGGALSGLIVLNMRGAQATRPLPALVDLMRWFVGHEAAHFWAGQEVRTGRAADAWITEGGADLLAVRAIQAIEPAFGAKARLQASVDECLALTGPGEALAGAAERSEHRASYACGALLLLAAEAGLRRGDPSADAAVFWRGLIERNRSDGVVESEEWLAAFAEATGDPALTAEVRAFVENGVDDPRAFLQRLFTAVGVQHRTEGERILLG